MSKKVILISYNYYPELTGIGKYNTEFCEYLAAKGYEVKVITAYPYYPNWKLQQGYNNRWYKKEIIHGVNIVRCPIYIPANPSGTKRILQDFSFYLSTLFIIIKQIMAFKKYDIIVSISPSFLNGLHGLLLKLFNRNSKFIYHVQDLQIDAAIELGIIKNEFIKNLLLTLEKYIITNANYVSTISIGMERKLFAKYE